MAAVLDSDYAFSINTSANLVNPGVAISHANPSYVTVENREGDWKAYLQQCANCQDNKNPDQVYGSVLAYKRACALAYLGRRAQFHGGVCSKTHPSILTPQCIADLEASNKTKRFSRYPWMETLLNLLAEIERIQDQVTSSDNVISLISGPK